MKERLWIFALLCVLLAASVRPVSAGFLVGVCVMGMILATG